MSQKNEETKKIPLGAAAGETTLYAVSLVIFIICGVWFPFRNFNVIFTRLGQAGERPVGIERASEIVNALYSWQGLLILIFIVAVVYFWWTSTWKSSMAKKGVRFLLWCLPAGLYILMMWILYWLTVPLRMLHEIA